MAFARAIFFLLVLGNLAFFAWGQGYLGGQEEGREPQRLKDQVQPEKLRIVAPAAAAAAPAPAACQVVGGLATAEAEKLRAALAAVAGLTVTVRPEAEPASYWVLIPPQPNKAAAEKKAAELKRLGIADFYIVTDEGPRQFAVSLGLFKSEAAAQEFLAGLAKKGVKSARVESRAATSEHSQVEVRGPEDAVTKGLAGRPATACPAAA